MIINIIRYVKTSNKDIECAYPNNDLLVVLYWLNLLDDQEMLKVSDDPMAHKHTIWSIKTFFEESTC